MFHTHVYGDQSLKSIKPTAAANGSQQMWAVLYFITGQQLFNPLNYIANTEYLIRPFIFDSLFNEH